MAASSQSSWTQFTQRAERAERSEHRPYARAIPIRAKLAWRRRFTLLLAGFAAMLAVLAAPGVASAEDPDDPDGSLPPTLEQALDALSKAYYDAEVILESSQQRQAEIKQNLDVAAAQLGKLTDQIGKVASARYKGGGVGMINGIIANEASRSELLEGAAVSEYLLWRDDNYIREYRVLKEEAQRQEALLNTEVELQSKQRDLLDQQKYEAERALAAAGGLTATTGFLAGTTRPAPQPTPRNPDGTLPSDPCSIRPDPTSGYGCVTFRTYHMLTEAKNAGFGRYVSCYRSGGSGEHPKGRACDFSATQYGFVASVASGDAKTYGDELATWAVANANALGVLYVIWFRQIWTPNLGWHRYSGQGGDPASDHTNHVHISMR